MSAALPQPLLCLPGPENWYNYDGDFSVHGEPIKLVQEGGQGRGTGWCVWDGAVVLARYMEAASRVDDASQQAAIPCAAVCSPTHCIELGAGTGLAGLSAAQAFQVPTVLTDVAEVQAALQHNTDLNPHLSSLVSAKVLDWHVPSAAVEAHTDNANCTTAALHEAHLHSSEQQDSHQATSRGSPTEQHPGTSASQFAAVCGANNRSKHSTLADKGVQQGRLGNCTEPALKKLQPGSRLLVLAADCVWVEELVHPFVSALKFVCELCEESVALLAHKERSRKVDAVMMKALQAVFTIESAPQLPSESRGSINIMQLLLKHRGRV